MALVHVHKNTHTHMYIHNGTTRLFRSDSNRYYLASFAERCRSHIREVLDNLYRCATRTARALGFRVKSLYTRNTSVGDGKTTE